MDKIVIERIYKYAKDEFGLNETQADFLIRLNQQLEEFEMLPNFAEGNCISMIAGSVGLIPFYKQAGEMNIPPEVANKLVQLHGEYGFPQVWLKNVNYYIQFLKDNQAAIELYMSGQLTIGEGHLSKVYANDLGPCPLLRCDGRMNAVVKRPHRRVILDPRKKPKLNHLRWKCSVGGERHYHEWNMSMIKFAQTGNYIFPLKPTEGIPVDILEMQEIEEAIVNETV